MPLEEEAVGRERQVAEALGTHRGEASDDVRQLATDERLATGEPDVGDPHPDHEPNQPLDLVGGEQLPVGQERHVLRWHAVQAAELARVGDADPQGAQRAAEAVDQRPFPVEMRRPDAVPPRRGRPRGQLRDLGQHLRHRP